MEPNLEAAGAALLGVSAGAIEFDSREALATISLALVRQARRGIDIVSRHLDPDIYDNEAFAEATRQLALGHRSARIRLLVIDPRPLVTRNHRLLELAMRLSTFVEMRVPALEHKSFNEALLVVDGQGYVHRQFSDRYEGVADFADRRGAGALTERFDQMWQRAEPDANFRRLHI